MKVGAEVGAKVGAKVGEVTQAAAINIVAETRAGMGVSQRVFARMIGCSVRSVASWEAGTQINTEWKRRVREVSRLHKALSRIMKPGALARWMEEPAPAFDGSTPLQIIERGEVDRLYEMIYDVRAGEPF